MQISSFPTSANSFFHAKLAICRAACRFFCVVAGSNLKLWIAFFPCFGAKVAKKRTPTTSPAIFIFFYESSVLNFKRKIGFSALFFLFLLTIFFFFFFQVNPSFFFYKKTPKKIKKIVDHHIQTIFIHSFNFHSFWPYFLLKSFNSSISLLFLFFLVCLCSIPIKPLFIANFLGLWLSVDTQIRYSLFNWLYSSLI